MCLSQSHCRWCAEGGNLICCDFCHNAFCKKCILRNLGRKELSTILDENTQWHCYICHPEPLLDLVTACDSVFENLEQLLQQNKKKMKVENEKSKIYDHTVKFSPKKNNANCNGEEKKLDNSYSGSLTYSYKALMVPKDLLKKTKKLIETTTNLNSSFVSFLKNAAENVEINPTVQLCQLKAFKSVLSDMKKAHLSLEEGLNLEIQALNVKIKDKNTKEKKTEVRSEKNEVKKDEGKEHVALKEDDATQTQKKVVSEQPDNEPMDQSVPSVEQTDNKAAPGEEKKSGRNEEPQYEPNSTEALDMDIVSIPSSVPEDIFETLESAMEIQMPSDEQDSGNTAADHETLNSNTKVNTPVKDTKGGTKLKSSAKGTKELVVKLTPVSLSESTLRAEDEDSSLEKDNKDVDGSKDIDESQPRAADCDSVKQNHNAGSEPSTENDAVPVEDSDLRRSPRVKTTPLRRPTDISPLTSNSEEDSNDTSNEKHKKPSKQPARKNDKRNSSDSTADGPGPNKLSNSKKPYDLDHSSDSDELPAVLKEAGMMSRSSSDSESNSETLAKNQKASDFQKSQPVKDENGKRKRKSSSSGSDLEAKRGKSAKNAAAAKKKRQNYSDSSNYDSELEKEIKMLSKIEAAKKSKKKYSQKDDSYDSSEEEQRKKVSSKRKVNLKKKRGKSSEDDDDAEKSSAEKEMNQSSKDKKTGKRSAAKDNISRDSKEKSAKGKRDESSDAEKSSLEKEESPEVKKRRNLKKKKAQDDSSSESTEKSAKKEHKFESSKDRLKNKKGSESKAKKSEKLNKKGFKKEQDDSSSDLDKSSAEKGSSNSSENDKIKKEPVFTEKRKLRERVAKRVHIDFSSDTEKSPQKEESSDDDAVRRKKRTEMKEKKKISHKKKISKKEQDDSSSSDEESYEDTKKKTKRGSVKDNKKTNLKKKVAKKKVVVTSSSSSDKEEIDDQNSTGDGSSDEQKIRPVTESLMLSADVGFCQSSGVQKMFMYTY